jgi:hypothetical protein
LEKLLKKYQEYIPKSEKKRLFRKEITELFLKIDKNSTWRASQRKIQS